jgi:uncharacterized membrane protein YdbT with pleckstrin-like domain
MSYITKNLMPGERVVHQARIHGSGYLPPTLGAILLGAAGLYFQVPLVMLGITVLILLLWLLAVHAKRMSTEFTVTDRRIILKAGILGRASSEILLGKIESVQIEQSLLDRLLDRGTLVFTGTGGNQTVLRSIAGPLEFHKQVQLSIEALGCPARIVGPGDAAA